MAPVHERLSELLPPTLLSRLHAISLSRALIYLLVFLAAFIPRALVLDAYVAPDEGKWIYRSAHFLQAFLAGNLAQMTSVAATPDVEVLAPAVPTMWTGALGLAAKYWAADAPKPPTLTEYLALIPAATEEIPLDFYPWTRFPTVLLTSLAVLAFYGLLLKITEPEVAVTAALLLALDPFFIGLSRVIHHDALVSIFIVGSLLTLLVYRQKAKDEAEISRLSLKSPRIWLILSGIAGGLALLTKPTALYLVIFTTLFLLLENGLPRRRSDWQRIILDCLVWAFIVLLIFVAFWPALWVLPQATLSALLERSANAVDENNNYALIPGPGSPLPELGFLFYPVNWLFKSTLPVLAGLVALLVGVGRGWFKEERATESPSHRVTESNLPSPSSIFYPPSTLWLVQWLALFCLLFLLLLIPADTRDIRYFLPAALVLQILAAIGISSWASKFHAPRFTLHVSRFTLTGLLLIIQLALTLVYAPYFVDYLNPIVGGPWLGPRLVKIGSGEGLDQMGRYLDQKPRAKMLTVATSFWESFVPFFSGRYTKPHYDEEADYVLIYLRQIQNNNPFPEYWAYFSARTPEYKVSLVGLDYAWLYPGPQLRVAREADFGGGISLRGYRLDRPAAQPGQRATLTLVWAGVMPAQVGRTAMVQLLDAGGQPVVESSGPVLDHASPSTVEGHYLLDLPAETPRGDYSLQVSLGGVSRQVGVIPVRQLDQPPARLPLSANFGDVILLGGADVTPPDRIEPGSSLDIKLVWQAQQPIPLSYTTFIHVVDQQGNIWGQVDRIPRLGETELPTNRWQAGEWVVDTFQLLLKPDMLPGEYTLLVGWYNVQTLERLPLIDSNNNQSAVEITTITVP